MSFQAPISIADAISRIRERRLLLPAIQREFVWEPAKVEGLFDSFLQRYPFGSFLFWEVRDDKTKKDYRFYEFIRVFRERYRTHNPEVSSQGHPDFYAVLDGQQRLTSLYVGLTGTYAYKMPRVWWEDSERALPTRKLYLNITGPAFVRVNSGGEPLSLSDMLMSTAIANWKIKDAKKEITELVDRISAKGFFISKDLVLKACLYLYSSDIRYKVANFSAAQVKPFEDNWEDIQRSVTAVFALVRDFGYDEKTLTSKNALLPIVYWIHHKGLQRTIVTQVALKTERDSIRRWLQTMLLKGIFGGSADTVLASIRKAFVSTEFGKPFVRGDLNEFPSEAIGSILQAQGRDPNVTDEFIDSLLYTQYEDKEAFSILALLAPNLDYRNKDFHKDHLHPRSSFTKRKLLAAGIPESDLEFYLDPKHYNSILNLRHLDSNENKSKQDAPLADWVSAEVKRQKTAAPKFCIDHDLPSQADQLEFKRFKDFIDARKTVLRERLKGILQKSPVASRKATAAVVAKS